uniref:Uncharacterized protein n=1 Tax=Setaria viridis TaxID=4556 RepID=A0A4U6U6W0_SETVI|nr:hypothetical protein SEVIR_6G147360v2 [Setaria viridis]
MIHPPARRNNPLTLLNLASLPLPITHPSAGPHCGKLAILAILRESTSFAINSSPPLARTSGLAPDGQCSDGPALSSVIRSWPQQATALCTNG